MSEFGVSRELALLPFVLYLLGLSFGPVSLTIWCYIMLSVPQVIAGPISETFGRRVVYIAALPCFGAFTIGAGFSQNIASLTVCRFLAGMASSPGLSLGSGTVADILRPNERAVPMGMFVTAVQMGPVMGPLVGCKVRRLYH